MVVEIEVAILRVTVNAEDVQFPLPLQQEPVNCKKPRFTEVCGYSDPKLLQASNELLEGRTINGPAVIHEYAAATYVASGWQSQVDSLGNLFLTHKGR